MSLEMYFISHNLALYIVGSLRGRQIPPGGAGGLQEPEDVLHRPPAAGRGAGHAGHPAGLAGPALLQQRRPQVGLATGPHRSQHQG